MNFETLAFFLIFILIPKLTDTQIVNKGTLQIKPSTTVYFENEYLNQSSGIHNNDGDLYLNNNFVNNGSTSSISGTTIFSSSVNDVQTISGTTGTIKFYNLKVNVISGTKKGVSVVNGFELKVANQVDLASGDLRLVGESQLVQTHTGLNANTSTGGKLLRDQQGISSTYGYNYWSSPVNNNSGSFSLNGGFFDGTDASINAFEPKQVTFNYGSPYNGVQAVVDGSNNVTTALAISDRWLYKYAPSALGFAGWGKIDKNSLLLPGVGFTMKGTGAVSQNYVFKGIPNDGTYTFNINAGQSALLGNPYPSALDSYKVINDNLSFIGELYLWVDGGTTSHYLANYLGGYSVQNLTGGAAPSVLSSIAGIGSAAGRSPKQYIAVGQGFFVEATNSGTITFDNSQRMFQIEDNVKSNFYKISNTKKSENLKVDETRSYIRIGYEDPEKFHRQLLLGFIPNSPANLDFNMGYDSMMIDPREDEVFFIIENDLEKKYVIQGVGDYDNLYEFPLGITITQQGAHTMMLDAVENFSDTVYIKDKVLNSTYNLSASSFSLNLPPGNYLDRFSIVFNNITLNSSHPFIENDLRVYFNNNNVIIDNKNNLQLSKVIIYNILSQKIMELNKSDLNDQKIIIPFVHQVGLYIVKVESGQTYKTFKIIN